MKKAQILIVCIGIIFLMSYSAEKENLYSSIVVSNLEHQLDLPEEPFDYALKINNALLTDTIDLGYGNGGIDTTILPLINDRVATLGRVLFYDKKLSALENISCGSCHLQSSSFADPKPLSVGVTAPTKRNSMHLNDLGWSNKESFFWDMKSIEIKEAIVLPLKDDNEIGANIHDVKLKLELTEYYPALFKDAFGDQEINESRIVEALADFILSINSFESKFDEVIKGENEFSVEEKSGQSVFAENCAFCHTQGRSPIEIFFELDDIHTASWFQNNGYIDQGDDRGATDGFEEGLPGLFKMPTLRNVGVTAPYMHDGNIPDLDSLINFYSHGVDVSQGAFFMPDQGFDFTETEKRNLKAFLLTFTDETMLINPKWSSPFVSVNSTEDIGLKVRVTPNPASDIAIVSVDGYSGKRKDVAIRDASGQIVLTDYFHSEKYSITRENLNVGLYIVSVQVGNKLGSYKLIVN